MSTKIAFISGITNIWWTFSAAHAEYKQFPHVAFRLYDRNGSSPEIEALISRRLNCAYIDISDEFGKLERNMVFDSTPRRALHSLFGLYADELRKIIRVSNPATIWLPYRPELCGDLLTSLFRWKNRRLICDGASVGWAAPTLYYSTKHFARSIDSYYIRKPPVYCPQSLCILIKRLAPTKSIDRRSLSYAAKAILNCLGVAPTHHNRQTTLIVTENIETEFGNNYAVSLYKKILNYCKTHFGSTEIAYSLHPRHTSEMKSVLSDIFSGHRNIRDNCAADLPVEIISEHILIKNIIGASSTALVTLRSTHPLATSFVYIEKNAPNSSAQQRILLSKICSLNVIRE